MFCPFCSNEETRVLESRLLENSVRRRRECEQCTTRFTTYEQAVFHVTVVKKDGREQAFDGQKIWRSIEKACAKADPEVVQALSKKVEQKVLAKKMNPIPTTEIGRLVLLELRKFDKMAYMRFASIHKSIDDPQLLKKEIHYLR